MLLLETARFSLPVQALQLVSEPPLALLPQALPALGPVPVSALLAWLARRPFSRPAWLLPVRPLPQELLQVWLPASLPAWLLLAWQQP